VTPALLALIICAPRGFGDQADVRLDHAAFLTSDTTLRIELNYDVPYLSLAFQREDSDYRAKYLVGIQCWNEDHDLVKESDWSRQIRLLDYDSTVNPDRWDRGADTVRLPGTRLECEVTFNDLQSERTREWPFTIEPPRYISELSLRPIAGRDSSTRLDSTPGAKGPKRPPQPVAPGSDSLRVYLETYRLKNQTPQPESIFLRVSRNGKTLAEEHPAIAQDSWRLAQQFEFPLAGYEKGTYDIMAEVFGPDGKLLEQRKTTFDVGGLEFPHSGRSRGNRRR
jgi:hypothetical protein